MIRCKLCDRLLIVLLFLLTMGSRVYAQNDPTLQNHDRMLKQVFEKDQAIRLKLDSLQSTDATPEQLLPMYRQMEKIDSENQTIALPVLDKYLAGRIDLSEESLSALFYVIQHASGEIQMKYEKFIFALWEKQVISNLEYAWFVDRLRVRQKKAQIYGLQAYMDAYTQDVFLYPVADDAHKRRDEIGLKEIEQELDESFRDEYAPIYISSSEYVIFGHTTRLTAEGQNREGVLAKITVRQKVFTTNEKGFYAIKLKRNKVPDQLQFDVDEKSYTRKVHYGPHVDWEIIDMIINDDSIR